MIATFERLLLCLSLRHDQRLLLCLLLSAGDQPLTQSKQHYSCKQQTKARSCVTKGAAMQWGTAAEDTLKLDIPIHTLMDALLN
jgi:uncharacterized protein YceK